MTSVIFLFSYWSWPLRSLKIIFRQSLDSEKNPEHHDFMYLLHLNRVAAEIVRNSDLPNKRSVLDALFHTANKDIWGSMIHSERVNRTEDFKSAINYMLMDIGHL